VALSEIALAAKTVETAIVDNFEKGTRMNLSLICVLWDGDTLKVDGNDLESLKIWYQTLFPSDVSVLYQNQLEFIMNSTRYEMEGMGAAFMPGSMTRFGSGVSWW